MASSGREKVAGRLASKRKSGDAATRIFKSDRGKEREAEWEQKKRPSRRRSARIDSGGEHPKVAVNLQAARQGRKG